ncbi:MAG: DUF401 family protein [candidate division Zixibacteria bacterium]|nr:DUF401 family protein [candidate division Zixibacteria bacterium]
MTWLGFLISLATILLISKKSLPLGLICGALLLGFFTLSPDIVLDRVILTLTDPSIVLLSLAMGIIPILGGTMKASGQIDSLVANVRIPQRYLLAFSAALMGLLPMPGGALLSAPILEKGGAGVPGKLMASINNWFRHLFILIYPLSSALIVSAELCDIDVYRAVIYLLPGFAVALFLGYLFLLRRVNGRLVYPNQFSLKELLVPLVIIISAPAVDFILKKLFHLNSEATLLGVLTGLALSIFFSRKRLDLKTITIKMKPWNFALIILGMFLYLRIFQVTETGTLIAALPLPPLMLALSAGFILGLVTGRVQLPASIIFPVYLAAVSVVTPAIFALIYIAIYYGYVISPVHPCLVVTCEYFGVSIKTMIGELARPTVILMVLVIIIALIVG